MLYAYISAVYFEFLAVYFDGSADYFDLSAVYLSNFFEKQSVFEASFWKIWLCRKCRKIRRSISTNGKD